MEIMDHKAKRNMAIMAWIPNIAFALCLVYYLYALSPLMATKDMEDHIAVATLTAQHYDTMFIMLATSAVLAAITLIYFIVHLARTKLLNSPSKVMWVVILAALVPVSFLLFYYLVVKGEPKYLDTYPDIA
jgi:hypothetical protein